MTDFLKRVTYLSQDTEFSRSHFDWCLNTSHQLYIIQKDLAKYSVAVNENSKTISKENQKGIICYNQSLSIGKGIELLQYLEENEVISKIPISRTYHRKLLQTMCSRKVNAGVSCTCGAVATYGLSCLSQKFMHSDYCDLIRRF